MRNVLFLTIFTIFLMGCSKRKVSCPSGDYVYTTVTHSLEEESGQTFFPGKEGERFEIYRIPGTDISYVSGNWINDADKRVIFVEIIFYGNYPVFKIEKESCETQIQLE